MLVLPGFGETKTDVLGEAYFLAKNGFNTLRFDYSYHIGESDGDITNTTLEALKNDILSCLDFVCRKFVPVKVGAVASSLASRALLRAGREDRRLRLLLNLVSIVDLQKTLFSIYQEDYLESIKEGKPVGIMDVLGFQIDAGEFLRSAIENSYENLQTTIDDVRHTEAPVVFFAAENDAWVQLDDVRQVIYAIPGKRSDLYILDGAMHELQENPAVSRRALNGVIASAVQYLTDPSDNHPIVQPRLREIGFRIRKEKLRNKIIYETKKEDERDFWKSYLDKYSFVVNVPDYWELMTLVYSLLRLGDQHGEESVLDAGCGIGNFGAYLLVKRLYAAKKDPLNMPDYSCHYVGLDFVEEAVLQARQTHHLLEQEFLGLSSVCPQRTLLNGRYVLADLEFWPPFRKGTFEKICCNLVISYLRNPLESMISLAALLKSGGRLVVSSLKPFADLSQVYRNFIKMAKHKTEIEEARKLLSNAGRIKAKEAHGVYEFFSETALTDLMRSAGLLEVETYRSLGNQANIVVGLKN
jgi:SAM-dependent methyltransferase